MVKIFLALFWLQVPALAVAGKSVSYKSGRSELEGYFEPAKGSAKGLIVIIHDWDGLTDYEIKRAGMLAASGYDAFAVDLYGKGNRPVETKAKKAETSKLYDDRETMRRLILAGLEEAQRHSKAPPIVIGYCFGGAAALELARSMKAPQVKGFATFHGGLQTPAGQKYQARSGPLFIAHGGADSGIPLSDVAALGTELEAAGVDYEIEIYSGAPHAFTVIGSERYQKQADEKSWRSFLAFSERVQK